MDALQWEQIEAAVTAAVKEDLKCFPRTRKVKYSDRRILLMYFYTVGSDLAQSHACDASIYNARIYAPRAKMPSLSQFNRRMSEPRAQRIMQRVHERLAGSLETVPISFMDGKPLLVGVASKDPDARRGHIMGGIGKGYKLHAWMTEDRRIPVFSVTPLNVGETLAAARMLETVQFLPDDSLVLVDQNYDCYHLHKAVAQRNGRLIANPKGDKPLEERHPVNLRQMGEARQELIAFRDEHPVILKMVLGMRVLAEGIFGNLCGTSGGLTHLPPWTRGLKEVTRWVGAKIVLYHARQRAKRLTEKVAA